MDWPRTLDLVLSLIGPDTVVVPGHGSRSIATSCTNNAARSASSPRRSATWPAAASAREALDAADWPYPREELADAVRRGYEQLPRAQKRLPLI